jgi:O-6-methylguanine DNA methyltransferase
MEKILKNKDLTDFEKKVYLAVSKIPKGETRSYSWVAAKIGSPRAARAVGNALNKNPYIGIVPCHRVIKSDGSIGGFAKGTKRKLTMLKSEGVSFRFKR